MQDIVDTAIANPNFSTLVAAVQAAGLAQTLKGPGPFTVFAPTDAAFQAALTKLGLTAEQLLADIQTLTNVLKYHVVSGEFTASDIMSLADGSHLKTVQGGELVVSNASGVKVDEANVTQTDLKCSNGVIHVIDAVIMPEATSAPAPATQAPAATQPASPAPMTAPAQVAPEMVQPEVETPAAATTGGTELTVGTETVATQPASPTPDAPVAQAAETAETTPVPAQAAPQPSQPTATPETMATDQPQTTQPAA